jgi:exodeoxyribonuclease V alpha subunit
MHYLENKLIDSNLFGKLDINFAKYIGEPVNMDEGVGDVAQFLAAMVSKARHEGYVSIGLRETFEVAKDYFSAALKLTNYEAWLEAINRVPAIGVPGSNKPLICFKQNLYLQKYWIYENNVYSTLKTMSQIKLDIVDKDKFNENLMFVYGQESVGSDNQQRKAAIKAAQNKLTIITGGPGTGKTTTLTSILYLYKEQFPKAKIALLAPTGKASQRITEAMQAAVAKLKIKSAFSEISTSTIHRMLGYRYNSPFFKHNENNPLNYDLIVIDEASMIDIALMSKLLMAFSTNTRLILVGDKNQLSSVEAGSFFGAFCINQSFEDNIINLTKNWRFGEDSGIGQLSQEIQSGKSIAELLPIFESYNDINHLKLDKDTVLNIVDKYIENYYQKIVTEPDITKAINLINTSRILCVFNEGLFGATKINSLIKRVLIERGYVSRTDQIYNNLPILITKNDYNLGLFNGDTGLIRATQSGELRAFFIKEDGQQRSYAPAMLPSYLPLYAMTIHRSQGSEFQEVIIILPKSENMRTSKELLYTAITRSKKRVLVMTPEASK